jgi:nucleoside phosphorylase
MKRMLTCSIVVAGLMAGFVAPAQATVSPANACRFQKLQAGNWTTYEVKVTVRCLAKRMNVDVSHAQYIAYRESRFHRKAISWTGCCVGVYQHQQKYWAERVAQHVRKLNKFDVHDRSWTSPRAQAVVTFAMVKQGGWGPWGG